MYASLLGLHSVSLVIEFRTHAWGMMLPIVDWGFPHQLI